MVAGFFLFWSHNHVIMYYVLICKPLENNKRILPHLFLIESVLWIPNSGPIKNLFLFIDILFCLGQRHPDEGPSKSLKRRICLSFTSFLAFTVDFHALQTHELFAEELLCNSDLTYQNSSWFNMLLSKHICSQFPVLNFILCLDMRHFSLTISRFH